MSVYVHILYVRVHSHVYMNIADYSARQKNSRDLGHSKEAQSWSERMT